MSEVLYLDSLLNLNKYTAREPLKLGGYSWNGNDWWGEKYDWKRTVVGNGDYVDEGIR